MDIRNFVVVVLVGAGLVLAGMLVVSHPTPTASAILPPAPQVHAVGRYQIAAAEPNSSYLALVLDNQTGAVYMLMNERNAATWDANRKAGNQNFTITWRTCIAGPPR